MRIDGDAKTIAAAFVAARRDMSATVSKDAKGNYGKYATLAAIVEATTGALAKHGLCIVQEASTDDAGLVIETWLVHESGATMQFSPLTLPLTDRKPQAVGSALTYGRRYALAAVCGLAPDDDDGQAAQDAETRAQAKRPAQPQADVIFDKPPRHTVASQQQLDKIAELGAQVYAGEWESNHNKLAEWASGGARNTLEALFDIEAQKLIKALEKKAAA